MHGANFVKFMKIEDIHGELGTHLIIAFHQKWQML